VQALWEESTDSVVVGELHGSTLLDDERRSGLNGLLAERVTSGVWDVSRINMVEVNNVCDGGNALLSALRAKRFGQQGGAAAGDATSHAHKHGHITPDPKHGGITPGPKAAPRTTPDPKHGSRIAPDPKTVAKLVGDAFLLQSAPPVRTRSGLHCPDVNGHPCGMMRWGYGGALIFDGMYQSIAQFGFSEWAAPLDVFLDAYTQMKDTPGFDLAHNKTRPWDNAVGDNIGLFPIAYLHRATAQGRTSGADVEMAVRTAEQYILRWPHRLSDGTFSRKVSGEWPHEPSSGNGSIVWADDQTMGTVLVARLAPLFHNAAYATEVTRQQIGFAKRLVDPRDGLSYHGFNEASGDASCCKWGRGNGWGMLGHAEALASMAAWPQGYPNATANARVREIFSQHAAAAKATQAADGRWHQLLNDTSPASFLETSASSMFLSAILRGIRLGVLDAADYQQTVRRAWAGLTSTILSNGTVTGVCCGTGIQANPEAYYERPTFYGCSGPGGAGAVLYAAVDLAKAAEEGLCSVASTWRRRRWRECSSQCALVA